MKVKSEFPTLSYPIDSSLSGSSAHGIFQARVLEWVAIAFSEQKMKPIAKQYTLPNPVIELDKAVVCV